MDNIKISAFVLTTNSIKNQFPFIESIKSFLPVVDELIVIDGGSTDGTIESIKKINDNKIRIIQDDDTKWEKEWIYWRMGHNFNRGLQECIGDWVIKFDADYILYEKGIEKFRADCIFGSRKEKLSIAFTRLNFIYADRFYVKSKKTLAINKTRCKELGINLKYGFDLDKWGWGFDFINSKEHKNKIYFGDMLRESGNSFISSLLVYNYDYVFTTKEVVKEARKRHWIAEMKQKDIVDNTNFFDGRDLSWKHYKELCKGNLNRPQYQIELEKHPLIIQDKIKNITKEQQGCNCFNWFNNKKYG